MQMKCLLKYAIGSVLTKTVGVSTFPDPQQKKARFKLEFKGL